MDFKEIKTYEDACMALGKDPTKLPSYDGCELSDAEVLFNLAAFKLNRVYQALNMKNGKPWVPMVDDYKYYPWMYHVRDQSKPSGVGLSFDDGGYGRSTTRVAARLCARTSEIAEYAFRQFQELYEDLICFRP